MLAETNRRREELDTWLDYACGVLCFIGTLAVRAMSLGPDLQLRLVDEACDVGRISLAKLLLENVGEHWMACMDRVTDLHIDVLCAEQRAGIDREPVPTPQRREPVPTRPAAAGGAPHAAAEGAGRPAPSSRHLARALSDGAAFQEDGAETPEPPESARASETPPEKATETDAMLLRRRLRRPAAAGAAAAPPRVARDSVPTMRAVTHVTNTDMIGHRGLGPPMHPLSLPTPRSWMAALMTVLSLLGRMADMARWLGPTPDWRIDVLRRARNVGFAAHESNLFYGHTEYGTVDEARWERELRELARLLLKLVEKTYGCEARRSLAEGLAEDHMAGQGANMARGLRASASQGRTPRGSRGGQQGGAPPRSSGGHGHRDRSRSPLRPALQDYCFFGSCAAESPRTPPAREPMNDPTHRLTQTILEEHGFNLCRAGPGRSASAKVLANLLAVTRDRPATGGPLATWQGRIDVMQNVLDFEEILSGEHRAGQALAASVRRRVGEAGGVELPNLVNIVAAAAAEAGAA